MSKTLQQNMSPAHKSFLENINVEFNKVLLAIYKYIKGEEYGNIAKEIGMNRKTVCGFFELLRGTVAQIFL